MALALYRRYRPDTFAEVIGQEQVTVPLARALDEGKLTHAYLFSGPRGCGKTSSARILARCINCVQGPTSTPCGVCESCRELSVTGKGSIDVVEIDAASHNGVDDARELRERAGFAPARDRYKIFILDEAHMVTQQGFNALLKIVEEPPEHVMFIFATTEPEKVIGTIRSRTHHYPFRLVPPEIMQPFLQKVCEQESVTCEDDVLPLVMRAGGGSVRDTLSILDQLMAGAQQQKIMFDSTVALLGFTPETLIADACEALINHDGVSLYQIIEQIVVVGYDPMRFIEDFLARVRDLSMIALVGVDNEQFILDDSTLVGKKDVLQHQAQTLGLSRLTAIADILNKALSTHGSVTPRMTLELLAAQLLVAVQPTLMQSPLSTPVSHSAQESQSPQIAPATTTVSHTPTQLASATMNNSDMVSANHNIAPNNPNASQHSDSSHEQVIQGAAVLDALENSSLRTPKQNTSANVQQSSDISQTTSTQSNNNRSNNASSQNNSAVLPTSLRQLQPDSALYRDPDVAQSAWHMIYATLPPEVQAYVNDKALESVTFLPQGEQCFVHFLFKTPLDQYAFALATYNEERVSAYLQHALREAFHDNHVSIRPMKTAANNEPVKMTKELSQEERKRINLEVAQRVVNIALTSHMTQSSQSHNSSQSNHEQQGNSQDDAESIRADQTSLDGNHDELEFSAQSPLSTENRQVDDDFVSSSLPILSSGTVSQQSHMSNASVAMDGVNDPDLQQKTVPTIISAPDDDYDDNAWLSSASPASQSQNFSSDTEQEPLSNAHVAQELQKNNTQQSHVIVPNDDVADHSARLGELEMSHANGTVIEQLQASLQGSSALQTSPASQENTVTYPYEEAASVDEISMDDATLQEEHGVSIQQVAKMFNAKSVETL